MSAIIAGMVAVATVTFLTALAYDVRARGTPRPAPPEEPRTEPNHRNRVVSMVMDSDLVLVDGRVLKNRWGDEEIPREEAAAVMRRCEGLLVRRFDRDARVLVLETPAQR